MHIYEEQLFKIIIRYSRLTIVLNRTTITVLVIMIALTRTSV